MNENEKALVAVLRGVKRVQPVTSGPVNFYHFWRHHPERGKINVAWIKDLRVEQLAMSGYIPNYLYEAIGYLSEDRARYSAVNSFVAPTVSFADSVIKWYGGDRPYALFANYPSRIRNLDSVSRRDEVVYIDYSSTVFQEELYRKLFAMFDEIHTVTGLDCVLVAGAMRARIEQLPRREHIKIKSINGEYDCRSRFGLLVNLTNFKQANECLPRKLLLYAHCGIVPAIHGTFGESISYCDQHNVPAIAYYDVEKLCAFMAEHKPCSWNRDYFCIENRIKNLVKYLNGLGASL